MPIKISLEDIVDANDWARLFLAICVGVLVGWWLGDARPAAATTIALAMLLPPDYHFVQR